MKVCYNLTHLTDHQVTVEGHRRKIVGSNHPYIALDYPEKIVVIKVVNCKDSLQGVLIVEIPKL